MGLAELDDDGDACVDQIGQKLGGVRGRSSRKDDPGSGSLAYVVLSLCRALRTVRTGMPGSKQEAAAWTREMMPEWAWLIDSALRGRMSRGTNGFGDERTRAAAQIFIWLLGDEITGSRSAEVSAATLAAAATWR